MTQPPNPDPNSEHPIAYLIIDLLVAGGFMWLTIYLRGVFGL